jgi:hypothetical protein
MNIDASGSTEVVASETSPEQMRWNALSACHDTLEDYSEALKLTPAEHKSECPDVREPGARLCQQG